MKIAFYAPFKPLDHPRPSGDLTTALGLTRFLRGQGHEISIPSRFRARNLASRPHMWPVAAFEAFRAAHCWRVRPDLWLTHHAYYKSPDVIGPYAARKLGVPYAIFQGIYSTKRRRSLATRLGFELNRRSLLAADMVFSNRLEDMENLRRLLPDDRLCYVPPGIDPDAFAFDAKARARLRAEWGVGERPVVLCVAMFRDDVKTQGLRFLLASLSGLRRDFELVLAGDGETRQELEKQAREDLPGRCRFLGQVPRERLFEVYSAADLFAFPGIRESLGMVYLEAQAAGLPVVAFDNGGIPEVMRQGETGILTPFLDVSAYRAAVVSLLDDADRRRAMGRAAMENVRMRHDAEVNFMQVDLHLRRLAGAHA